MGGGGEGIFDILAGSLPDGSFLSTVNQAKQTPDETET